jgi:preprotein translocase subunit SecA
MAMAAAAGAAGVGAPGAEQYGDDEAQSMLPPPVEQRRVDETQQLGRNDPCWCGSGKKFKKCHGA